MELTSRSHAIPKPYAKPYANHTFRLHGAARMSSHGAHMGLTWFSHDVHMSSHGTDMELTWSSHDLTCHAHWGDKVTHIWYVTTYVTNVATWACYNICCNMDRVTTYGTTYVTTWTMLQYVTTWIMSQGPMMER